MIHLTLLTQTWSLSNRPDIVRIGEPFKPVQMYVSWISWPEQEGFKLYILNPFSSLFTHLQFCVFSLHLLKINSQYLLDTTQRERWQTFFFLLIWFCYMKVMIIFIVGITIFIICYYYSYYCYYDLLITANYYNYYKLIWLLLLRLLISVTCIKQIDSVTSVRAEQK